MKNDLAITHWEREAKNRMQELATAIRDGALWQVKESASALADAANQIRWRSIAIAFDGELPKGEVKK